MATGTDDPTRPAPPAERAVTTRAETNAVEAEEAVEAPDARKSRMPEADMNELLPEERIEQAKRDSRRSAVRVRVTYLAAGFLFVAGAAIVGYLLAVGKVAEAKDLFLAILPVSAAIVTYWFATRRGEAVSMEGIAKVIEVTRTRR